MGRSQGEMGLLVREVNCKSILSRSGLADYTVNCYAGCEHGCRYCYARFIKRFTHHREPWGEFVDVRVNAPQVLARQLRRARPGRVFLSSVCDGWQPLEEDFGLTRDCLRLLVEAGWPVTILTKSHLATRDLDLLEGREGVEVGVTVTVADEALRRRIEPRASPTAHRLEVLKEAAARGIRVWAFIGPFMPCLSDDQENIACLMREVARLPVTHVYVDRLNFRPGVAASVNALIEREFPHLLPAYQELEACPEADSAYSARLRKRARQAAEGVGLAEKVRMF